MVVMAENPLDPKPKPKVSSARLLIWLGVAVVALYSIITGIIGVMHNG
jgi:hypothetical protein